MCNPAVAVASGPRLKTRYVFLILLLCEMSVSWFYQTQIMTKDAYYALYGDRLDAQRIEDMFDLLKQFRLWSFGMIPLFVWFRAAFITLLLQMPLVFRFIDIPFRDLFRLVTVASFLFVVFELLRLLYLLPIPSAMVTLKDLNWMPLSLVSLLALDPEARGALAFLSHFNLFEIGFLGLIYIGLIRTKKLKKLDAALVVFIMWMMIIIMHWILALYFARLYG
ncbi:MAG TPA: hypothetical protein PK843_13360 [bacterium]|nr:hypothetical protein [bacterium]